MAAPERPISGIAVCVATRDRPEGLARLLDSLTRLDPPSLPVRVVVIDNSPVPSSAPVVESVADRLRIEWFHEPRTGISFARNAALDRLAADEVMACIDDDCVASPNWLVRLTATLEDHEADAVGGPTYLERPADAREWVHRVGFPTPSFAEGERVRHVQTGNAMFVVRFLRHHGLRFDERFPLLGGEDSWLSHEIRRVGGAMVWSADARVVEPLPPHRVTVRWLVRRRFRYGYSASLRLLADRRSRAMITEVARVGYRTAVGLLWIVAGVITGRRRALHGLLRLAAAAGSLWALLGGDFADYRSTDGR
jgi:succinoglycan biosynthesis protein ExoM